MKLSFSSSASLFLVIIINGFIQFSEAQGQPGKPHIKVDQAAGGGMVYIACSFSQQTNKNISCYLYTGDTPEPFTSTWTTGGKVCNFYIHNTDLQKHLESALSRELSCDYTVNTKPPTHSPRSDKSVIGDDKLNLTTATRSPTKTSNQPKTTRISKGFTHRTTITPATMKPESADNKSNLSTATSTTKASKQPNSTQNSMEFTHRTTITSATKRPETIDDKWILPTATKSPRKSQSRIPVVLRIGITVAVLLLGAPAFILFWKHRNAASQQRGTQPKQLHALSTESGFELTARVV
ncbi:uncharacterized protein [Paramormyrops kingsleyae]|uniref:uncharacterized protein isoform X2 n=1 Tax=Paramormyrops kingsleyae TaxID=1676925 RepID=UPI003B972397